MPDEMSDEDFNELAAESIDEKLADESRDAIWLSQGEAWIFGQINTEIWTDTGIDSLKWPQALTVRPVEVRRFK